MNSKKSFKPSSFNAIILAYFLLCQALISRAEIISGVTSIPTSNAWYYCSSTPVTSSSFFVSVVSSSTSDTLDSGKTTEVLLPTNVDPPNGGVIVHFFNETGMNTYLDPTAMTFYYYAEQSCKDPVMACSHKSSSLESRVYCLSVSNSNLNTVKASIYLDFGGGGTLPTTFTVPTTASSSYTTTSLKTTTTPKPLTPSSSSTPSNNPSPQTSTPPVIPNDSSGLFKESGLLYLISTLALSLLLLL